ncbi:hypothetical protein [Enterobacter sp. DC1]|uniref:hypothetical protein n=1 Tax=Enterobacter sp. DC1 TaxID=314330 RepID=UPI00187C6E0E|nr:hypothetical protein [Enterobacter sp. DC1]
MNTVLSIGDAKQVAFANRMNRFLLTVKITRLLTEKKLMMIANIQYVRFMSAFPGDDFS